MRIIIGSLSFPSIVPVLGGLLPADEITPCPQERLAEAARQADVIIPTMARVDREVISGSSLRLIQQWGVGLEGVDLAAAAEAGVPVCNVPAGETPNALSTAEQALFLMMAAARRINVARQSLVHGPWGSPQGRTLWGQEALIVGLGGVGKALAARLAGLEMRISGIKAHPDPYLVQDLGLVALGGPQDLRAMLGRADFVVSCLTANPQTMGLFDAAAFAAMKPGAIFVNVGRGKVVDEGALLAALNSGHLAGAGLDVFATEPVEPHNPLLAHPDVVAMPHTGGVTEQSYAGIGRQVAANIERLRDGRPLMFRAGPK